MKETLQKTWTVLRTNEDGARTKAIIAASITVGAIAGGLWLTKKNAVAPVNLFIVEETVEAVSDAASV